MAHGTLRFEQTDALASWICDDSPFDANGWKIREPRIFSQMVVKKNGEKSHEW